MNGSGHLEEDFSQPLFLCPVDLRKLSQLANVDFVQRYEQLLEFCANNQFKDEIDLLKKRIDILKNEQQCLLPKRKHKYSDQNTSKRKSKRLKIK